MVEIINLIISILSGIAVCIPLAIKLVDAVKKLWQEKNWAPVMQLVLKFMAEAEELYKVGADKKAYVMKSIEEIQNSLNYKIDMEVVSVMIDSICDASRKINVKPKEEK